MNIVNIEEIVTQIKEKLDETSGAKISEELLGICSLTKNHEEQIRNLDEENKKLKEEKDEVLKVNGRLFQQIGFQKTITDDKEKEKDDEDDIIKLEEIINQKGELL